MHKLNSIAITLFIALMVVACGGGGGGNGDTSAAPTTATPAPAPETASIGERAGPGFSADEIIPAIERLVLGYLDIRENDDETFLAAYRRLGADPFKAILYPLTEKAA